MSNKTKFTTFMLLTVRVLQAMFALNVCAALVGAGAVKAQEPEMQLDAPHLFLLNTPSHWSTYYDPRYNFSIEYPNNWEVIPRDDQSDRYGGVIVFKSTHQIPEPIQVVVGLHTVERDPAQDLTDWTKTYLQMSSPFLMSDIQIKEFRSLSLSGKPALAVQGNSPLTAFQFVNVSHGRTVWFIWTNAQDELSTAIYQHMVQSFKIYESAPSTLTEAFGPSFRPLPRHPRDDAAPISITGVIPAPSGWRVPTPAGSTYIVNCGSPYHTGTAAYATDISMNVGTPVYAAHLGWVDFAGWDSTGYGNLIKISTDFIYPRVYTSYYAHLQSFAASPGQYVGTSGLIAYSGNTGQTTGAHLHFHTRSASDAVDLRNLYVFDENNLYPSGYGLCGYMYR